MSDLSSCSSDSGPHRTCRTVLLAWKGVEKKDCSHTSWKNTGKLSRTFHTFMQNNFFYGNAFNPAVPCSKPRVGFLPWQIQDESEKQCEKKHFCQAVAPSFVSESENFRAQKTILLQLLLCGKRKKPPKYDEKDCGEIPAELSVPKRRCRVPRPRTTRRVEDGYGLAWILQLQNSMGFSFP